MNVDNCNIPITRRKATRACVSEWLGAMYLVVWADMSKIHVNSTQPNHPWPLLESEVTAPLRHESKPLDYFHWQIPHTLESPFAVKAVYILFPGCQLSILWALDTKFEQLPFSFRSIALFDRDIEGFFVLSALDLIRFSIGSLWIFALILFMRQTSYEVIP